MEEYSKYVNKATTSFNELNLKVKGIKQVLEHKEVPEIINAINRLLQIEQKKLGEKIRVRTSKRPAEYNVIRGCIFKETYCFRRPPITLLVNRWENISNTPYSCHW